ADAVSSLKRALARSPYATASEWGPGAATLPDGILAKVDLKSFVEQQRLEGYDPNLDVLLVTEEKLQCLVELQQAVLQCVVSNRTAGGQGSCCHVVHVVSCEEEFRQQQMDLLWRILDPGAHTALQKHLVCGPVKVAKGGGNVGMERAVHVAPLVFSADEAWTEVIDVLTAAAIRFEMLSTAHRSQIVLDLEDSSISTKGTKSGAFVMYNCARLATLFDTYQRAVERGEPQPNGPPPLAATPGLLLMAGEWLLLFNYLLPFPEVLQQAAQLPAPSKGIRITASTESVSRVTPGHAAVPGGGGAAQEQTDPTVPALTLCVAGVQVPDPAQHGFQLLLQPCPRPGGESNIPSNFVRPPGRARGCRWPRRGVEARRSPPEALPCPVGFGGGFGHVCPGQAC
uniref:DALR anticodon binding domain containing 3 n=1 Tax=Apteryx owenii TaxID=8824 RepID=A0A8B9QB26_APTOW